MMQNPFPQPPDRKVFLKKVLGVALLVLGMLSGGVVVIIQFFNNSGSFETGIATLLFIIPVALIVGSVSLLFSKPRQS